VKSFLATLTDDQRAGIAFPYPTGQTTAAVADFSGRVGEKFGDSVWSNYPISDVIWPGLKMGDLSEEQHTAALAFLSAALSPAGYQKVRRHHQCRPDSCRQRDQLRRRQADGQRFRAGDVPLRNRHDRWLRRRRQRRPPTWSFFGLGTATPDELRAVAQIPT
jgi:hypothetical protein